MALPRNYHCIYEFAALKVGGWRWCILRKQLEHILRPNPGKYTYIPINIPQHIYLVVIMLQVI